MLGRLHCKVTSAKKRLGDGIDNLRFKARVAKVGKLRGIPAKKGRQRVLVWAPEAGLHPHYHTCCLLARVLQDAGHAVFTARCYRQLDRCVVKGALRLPFDASSSETRAVCADCAKNSFRVQDSYGLQFLDLRALETPEHRIRYEQALENLRAARNESALGQFTFEGLPLGQMCGYEVRLGIKALNLNEKNQEIATAWATLIRTSIKTYLLVDEAVEQMGFSKLVYFNDYSMNLAARFAIESRGGSAVMVTHAYNLGVDRSRFVFNKNLGLQAIFTDCLQWPRWKSTPLPQAVVSQITDDAIFRFSGRSAHTYSPPLTRAAKSADEPKFLKRVVVYTSSPDESACLAVLSSLGLEVPPVELTFGTSCEDCHEAWLVALKTFALTRPEIEFVVRIHPREGANKREPSESEHLGILRKCLEHVPPNFTVHWPESPVSSYDLGESADLVLTSWSTIGLEMARLGVPVLCCARGVAGYPVDDFQTFVQTPDAYFRKIDELLFAQPSLENIRAVYRWWHLAYLSPSIDVSDVVPTSDFTALPANPHPRNAGDLCASILEDFDQREALLQDWPHRLNSGLDGETEALKRNLRRFIRFFLTGTERVDDYLLVVRGTDYLAASPQVNRQDMHIERIEVVLEGHKVTAHLGSQFIERDSPLVARLCMLAASNS
jgi:hypothetical protein